MLVGRMQSGGIIRAWHLVLQNVSGNLRQIEYSSKQPIPQVQLLRWALVKFYWNHDQVLIAMSQWWRSVWVNTGYTSQISLCWSTISSCHKPTRMVLHSSSISLYGSTKSDDLGTCGRESGMIISLISVLRSIEGALQPLLKVQLLLVLG